MKIFMTMIEYQDTDEYEDMYIKNFKVNNKYIFVLKPISPELYHVTHIQKLYSMDNYLIEYRLNCVCGESLKLLREKNEYDIVNKIEIFEKLTEKIKTY